MVPPRSNDPGSFDFNAADSSQQPEQPRHPRGSMTASASDDEVEDTAHNGSETPSDKESPEEILPRDRQLKTPTYDYAFEKSMSHAEAKLFYRHHQLASRNADSECSQSPVLAAHSPSNHLKDDMRSNESAPSLGAVTVDPAQPQPLPSSARQDHMPAFYNDQDHYATAANHSARNQAVYHGVPHEQGPYLSDTEGVLGPGSVMGGFQGLETFARSDAAVTSELAIIYRKLQGLRARRSRYIQLSSQGPDDNPKDQPQWRIYPPPPEPSWDDKEYRSGSGGGSSSGQYRRRKMGQDIGEDFDMAECMPLPEESNWIFRLDGNSIYQVYENEGAAASHEPIVHIPSLRDFYIDLDAVVDVSTDGPAKSYSFKRLSYLEGKFQLYSLLNEYQEIADSKKVPHRDFYNVRKVDTHVHHSACMNQKHLLRFIKSKMKKSPDEVVLFRDEKHLTLREVFESINLTAYDLSIDTLDMHVCIPSVLVCLGPSQLPLKLDYRHTRTPFIDLINLT